ncbi:MAG: YwaF family protein, partial [Clostridia bacterium]|nr:YwaF family protein [Clostridia bacterium]
CNLLLLWSLGAIMAIVVNTAQADYDLLSWTFFFYYFPHTMQFGIPILLFKLGLCKLDARCIFSTVGITAGAYTVIHFINVALNSHCLENNITTPAGEIVQVNYMYSITPDNPVLVLFHNLIPHSFWYMLPAVLIAAVYLAAIYGIAAVFSKKKYC